MISITPAASISTNDPGLTADPNQIQFGGALVACPVGAMAQDVVLPPATSNLALSFPVGVTTAAILAIYASGVGDLVVKVSGVSFTVPAGQPFFLYGVAAAAVSVSSVAGGKFTYVVGG